MKLNLEQVILDVDGNARKNIAPVLNDLGLPTADADGQQKFESNGDLKLKDVLYSSVNQTYKGEEPKPEELYQRGKLARKVKRGGEVHFSNDDITIFKNLSAKRYAGEPYLVLSILEMIDPDNKIFKEEEKAE